MSNTQEKKWYLTHYEEYPIYEPADGGYYYAGREYTEYIECSNKADAIHELQYVLKEDLESLGFIVDETSAYLPSKYIGEGESWVIEETLGSLTQGKRIYE